MDSKTMDCPSCGQLAAQMKEDSSISHRQYDQLLQKLRGAEPAEVFAGAGIPPAHPGGRPH